jgi:lysozyme
MKNIKNKLLALGLSSFIATSGVFVAKHEGLVLGTYLDPVGILTNCFGHTGKELNKGQKFTEEQCLQQLADDLVKHDKQMMGYIHTPISDEERAAYLSFVYNVGAGNFSKSTLLKKVNAGDRVGACNELPRWNRAGGKILSGLTKRRLEEKELCLKGATKKIGEVK